MKRVLAIALVMSMLVGIFPSEVVRAEELTETQELNESEGSLDDECSHEWEIICTLREVTCQSQGVVQEECVKCGETQYRVQPKVGHLFDLYQDDNNATCESDGTKTAECIYGCGGTNTQVAEGTALGHLWNEGVMEVETSCTSEGSILYTCTRCGVERSETTDAWGHHYEEVSYKEASCSEEGERVSECVTCHDTITEMVDKLSHIAGAPVLCDATCTKGGYTITSCSVCGELIQEEDLSTLLPELGHDYVEGVCSRCGDVYYQEFYQGKNDIEISAGKEVWAKFSVPETGWYCIFTDHSYPDLLLRVYDSEKNNVRSGMSSNNGTTKQTYLWVELVGGETYYIVSYFYSETRSGEVSWNILDVTVESIDIDTKEIIENTQGSWQNYGYDSQYWDYKTTPWYTSSQLVVKYRNGNTYNGSWSQVCNEITNERGIFPEYYVVNGILQNSSNRLQIGETYTGSMRFDGQIVDYSVKIIETPVESITIESQNLKVNTNGNWVSYGTAKQYWNYYTERAIDKITVVYKDGRTYTGSLTEVTSAIYMETGRYPYSSAASISQSYTNQLEKGKNYTGILLFDGFIKTYDVKVVDTANAVTSIVVETEDIIEYTKGSWISFGTKDQYWNYHYVNSADCISTLTVTYTDGLSFSGSWEEVLEAIKDEYGCYPSYSFSGITQNAQRPLTLGNTYNGTMTFDGYTTEYGIRIVETPVKSIDIETKEIAEYTNGHWFNYGTSDQHWAYFKSSCIKSIKVEYKDGSVYQGTLDKVLREISEATGRTPDYCITNPIGQSSQKLMKVGETYIMNILFDGYVTSFDMRIVENTHSPVSVVVEVGDIVEYTHGVWRDYGTKYQYWEYYETPNFTNRRIEVTYADGQSFYGSFYDVVEEIYRVYGRYPDYRIPGIQQNYQEQLCAGETYAGHLTFDGYTTEYTIRIIDSPVESIIIDACSVDVFTNGHWENYGETEQYWHYQFEPSNIIDRLTVNYRNGDSYSGTWSQVVNAIYNATGIYPYSNHIDVYQSFGNPLEVGKSYTNTLMFEGVVTEYEVSILENSNPVISIIIEPMEIYENTQGYWKVDEDSDQYWYYYNTDLHDTNVQMTVTYKDGSVYSGTHTQVQEAIYMATGEYPYYTFDGISQSYTNQLKVGETYRKGLLFGGYATEYEVRIVENPNPITSITIEPLEVIENTGGYWLNSGETGQYWYYWNHPVHTHVQMSIAYQDGTEYRGTWSEVFDEIENDTGRRPTYSYSEINQSYDNQLQTGETYRNEIEIDGFLSEYKVTLLETPVQSIITETKEVFENTNGYWENYGESEQYWRYSIEPNIIRKMTVTYKDGCVYSGTWNEVQNAINEAIGRYPEYSFNDVFQSYENQLEVGETYTGILTFDGYTTEYDIQIVENPNPVTNITIEPIEIIEGTNGGWDNHGEPDQYWRYSIEPYIIRKMTVTYKDGSMYSGTWNDVYFAIQEVIGKNPEYSIKGISQSYENQLEVGGSYTGTLTFEGYITEFTFHIVETPIESIIIETKESIENTNGTWQNYGEPNQRWFYYTDPFVSGVQVTITYKDGCVYSGTWNAVKTAIQNDRGYAPQGIIVQGIDLTENPRIGEIYTGLLSFGGYTAEFGFKILESPIESISAEPRTVIAGTNGYYQTAWSNGTTYWYYNSIEPLMYHVVMKNGEEYVGSAYDIYTKVGESPICNIPQSWYDEISESFVYGLEKGEHVFEVQFLGKFCDYTLSIVDTPIEHISVSPIRLIENYGGTIMDDGWYKYDLGNYNRVQVELTLEDGSVCEVNDAYLYPNYLYLNYDNTRYELHFADPQSADNPWDKGSHYVTATSPDGSIAELEFVVGESPVKDIILDNIVCYESVLPYFHDWFWYFSKTNGWAVLTDDTVVKFYNGSVYLDDGSNYQIEVLTDRSLVQLWGVGEHEAVVSVAGYQKTVQVQVLPGQIDSVELYPITVVENQLGYWRSTGNGENWYWYDVEDYSVEGCIYFKDGSQCMLSEAIRNRMIIQYGPLLHSNQSYENQWTVGENQAYCFIGGVDYPVTVIVEENPIKQITVDDLYLNELEDFWVDEDGHVQIDSCNLSRLQAYIEMKDGSILRLTSGAYESGMGAVNAGFLYKGQAYGLTFNRKDHGGIFYTSDLDGFHPDKPRNEWMTGDVITFTAYVMGVECHFQIHFESETYTTLTISDEQGLVLTFTKSDGYTEVLRATELVLDVDGRWGNLYTDKGSFRMPDAFHITFDGKIYKDALRTEGLSGLQNVQIRVGSLTSNVLEDASWFIEQLSPDKMIVKTIPDAIALACRSLEYNAAEFDGTITKDNIDFLIETAFAYSVGYMDNEVHGWPYGGISVYRSEESITDAVSSLFGLQREEIDLSSSRLYSETKKTFRIPVTYGDKNGDITQVMNTEVGMLIWNSQGISVFVRNSIIEKIQIISDDYTGGVYTLADGNLWYVARSLVQTNYSGELVVDGIVYEIANGKVVQNDHEEDFVNVQGCSLTLAGDIGLNFYLNLNADLVASGAYAVFEQNGIISEPVLLSTVPHQGNQYKLTYHVAAKEMDDTIILKLYDGEGKLVILYKGDDVYENGYSYSVNAYVDLALNSDNVSAELKELMQAMREYGNCAQDYFGVGAGSASSVELGSDVFEDYAMVYQGNGREVTYYGSSLLLKNMTTIRHYFRFTGDPTGYNITINGSSVSMTPKGELYYVEIANIAAQDLEEMPIVTVYNESGEEEYQLVYGAFSYAREVMDQGKESELQSLMAALYLYWQSAEVYFTK